MVSKVRLATRNLTSASPGSRALLNGDLADDRGVPVIDQGMWRRVAVQISVHAFGDWQELLAGRPRGHSKAEAAVKLPLALSRLRPDHVLIIGSDTDAITNGTENGTMDVGMMMPSDFKAASRGSFRHRRCGHGPHPPCSGH